MNGSFIWCKSFGSRLFRFVTVYAFDRQTDTQTDRCRQQDHAYTHWTI